MRPYVEAADKFGYEVKVQQSETDWAWNAKKCGAKNGHGVPTDKIQIMLNNYEQMKSLDDVRNAKDNRRRNPHNKR